jgi:hypothetical protein
MAAALITLLLFAAGTAIALITINEFRPEPKDRRE